MCEDDLPRIEDLPQRMAASLSSDLAAVLREVRTKGAVAISRHNKVEVVILDAGEYRRRTAKYPTEAQLRASLAELTADFDRRLASLQDSDAHERVKAVMDARGETKRRPKAGEF